MDREERGRQFREFKEKAIAKAKRLHMSVKFTDGTVYDFRRQEKMKKA